MISIIDYGAGNLKSVEKALRYLNVDSKVTFDSDEINKSDGVILPGVGAFPMAMESLKKRGLDKVILDIAKEDKPFLGICLGMQMLFDVGEEIEETKGLGIIKGRVREIYGDVKIPHMGWNSLIINKRNKLFEGIPDSSYVYFVHSYYAEVENKEDLNAYSEYGNIDITAAVSRGNIYGLQFHPEKSGDLGLKILKNFVDLTI
ncbi:glutamine amidotransferase [Clostridium algifaecis]|uniref:Imidazole glycerol phosphate synthase subunit HisH n=1 Tax=Clostridium algifaecis TaxID=1472040 RepID=A0ABS4KNC8_9CLOT|nr:imidazole glycerol phosphate synthase subunit HisH [Clostridium algifaecis]MBP2031548.1 glutamine amidotransferase [Clostridium algifaecis]